MYNFKNNWYNFNNLIVLYYSDYDFIIQLLLKLVPPSCQPWIYWMNCLE